MTRHHLALVYKWVLVQKMVAPDMSDKKTEEVGESFTDAASGISPEDDTSSDAASEISSKDDPSSAVDGDKWVLFNNGSESTAWLQVLYGLGFADYLDYNKHDFYFVQYQRVDDRAPKFELFGVKRKADVFAQIDSVAEVDVTSTLLQSLQRSEYFMLNLSDEAQICINVLLSAFNMRPNDMNRDTTQLILTLLDKINIHIQDALYHKMSTEEPYEMTPGDASDVSHFDTEHKDIKKYYTKYVQGHLSVDRLCKRMQALVIADGATAERIARSALAEAQTKLASERKETKRLKSELEEKERDNTRLSTENKKIANLETRVTSLQSEKSEIENKKGVLYGKVKEMEAKIAELQIKLTLASTDVSRKKTADRDGGDADPSGGAGGKRDRAGADSAGGARGKGSATDTDKADDSGGGGEDAKETGRTGAEYPAKAAAGGGETGRTKETDGEDVTDKATTGKQRLLESLEGHLKSNLIDTDTDTETNIETVKKTNEETIQRLSEMFKENAQDVDFTKLNQTLQEMKESKHKELLIEADGTLGTDLNDIKLAEHSKLLATIFLQLSRVRDAHADRLSEKCDLNQLKISDTKDDGAFTITINNQDVGETEVLQIICNFINIYALSKQITPSEAAEIHVKFETWIEAVKTTASNSIIGEIIDYLFDAEMGKFLKETDFSEMQIEAYFMEHVIEPTKARASSVRAQKLIPERALYKPSSAYDTACSQHLNNQAFAGFVPVMMNNAHFSTGYMY